MEFRAVGENRSESMTPTGKLTNGHGLHQRADDVTNLGCVQASELENLAKYGKIIPNRIFVGGMDGRTTSEELKRKFSKFGPVVQAKVVRDRADVSKGFGFVTFENEKDAAFLKSQEFDLQLQGRKLNIRPAVERIHTTPKDLNLPAPSGCIIFHPRGYASYTHENGITYFNPPMRMVASSPLPHQPQQSMLLPQAPPTYCPPAPCLAPGLPCPAPRQCYIPTPPSVLLSQASPSYCAQASCSALGLPCVTPGQCYIHPPPSVLLSQASPSYSQTTCSASGHYISTNQPLSCPPPQLIQASGFPASAALRNGHGFNNFAPYPKAMTPESLVLTPPLTPDQCISSLRNTNAF